MPIKNCPFSCIDDNFPRPWLPIIIVNPHTGKEYKTYGLVDTGSDGCAIPAFIATELGHDLLKGNKRNTGTAGGKADVYSHTTVIEIYDQNLKKVYTVKESHISCMPNLPIPLLGVQDFLGEFYLNIEYPKQKFSVQKIKS